MDVTFTIALDQTMATWSKMMFGDIEVLGDFECLE